MSKKQTTESVNSLKKGQQQILKKGSKWPRLQITAKVPEPTKYGEKMTQIAMKNVK